MPAGYGRGSRVVELADCEIFDSSSVSVSICWVVRVEKMTCCVRSQLGHADLRTTQKYLETFRSSNESVLARLESRLRDAGVRSDVDTLWTPEAEATLPMSASQ